VDGDYLSARLVDGTARVVVRSTPMLPFEPPSGHAPDADWTELEAAATARNREVVASSTIDQWLPSYTLEVGDEERSGQLVPCERVSHPVDFSGFTAINVLTIRTTAAWGGSPRGRTRIWPQRCSATRRSKLSVSPSPAMIARSSSGESRAAASTPPAGLSTTMLAFSACAAALTTVGSPAPFSTAEETSCSASRKELRAASSAGFSAEATHGF